MITSSKFVELMDITIKQFLSDNPIVINDILCITTYLKKGKC